MPIKDPILFITVDEFKSWQGFDPLLFKNVTNSDQNIYFAIIVASENIDWLSGHNISKKWPEDPETPWTDNIKTATAIYVRFLCSKGVDYTRGQASMSQGGIVYSENAPDDPYFIPPEVITLVRKIKEYPNLKGYNLSLEPKRNDPFSNFYSNSSEDSLYKRYLQITNLVSLDPRVKITNTTKPNIIGTIVQIDTTNIKSYDNPIKPGNGISIDSNNKISVITDVTEYIAKQLLEINKYSFNGNMEAIYPFLVEINNYIQDQANPILSLLELKEPSHDVISYNHDNPTFTSDNNLINIYYLKKVAVPELNTSNKTVIGAINELKTTIPPAVTLNDIAVAGAGIDFNNDDIIPKIEVNQDPNSALFFYDKKLTLLIDPDSTANITQSYLGIRVDNTPLDNQSIKIVDNKLAVQFNNTIDITNNIFLGVTDLGISGTVKLDTNYLQYEPNGDIGIYTQADKKLANDLLLTNNYITLTTTSKTVVGSINELNARSPDKSQFYTKTEVDALIAALTAQVEIWEEIPFVNEIWVSGNYYVNLDNLTFENDRTYRITVTPYLKKGYEYWNKIPYLILTFITKVDSDNSMSPLPIFETQETDGYLFDIKGTIFVSNGAGAPYNKGLIQIVTSQKGKYVDYGKVIKIERLKKG